MRIRVFPEEDGTTTIYLQRTRPKEKNSRIIEHVSPESLKGVVSKAVKEMRDELADESSRDV